MGIALEYSNEFGNKINILGKLLLHSSEWETFPLTTFTIYDATIQSNIASAFSKCASACDNYM